MIKAVLFDYGGVLTEGGTSGCIQRYIGAVYGIDPKHINADRDLMLLARAGNISETDFFDEMNRRHPEGERLTRQNFFEQTDSFARSNQVYELAVALRNKGIKTGILSNIFNFTADELCSRGLYDAFEPIVLSGTEHLAKPDPKIYQVAISRLGVQAHQILFIDDLERNLVPARKLGMYTILAISPQQIVDETQALLLKENQLTLQ